MCEEKTLVPTAKNIADYLAVIWFHLNRTQFYFLFTLSVKVQQTRFRPLNVTEREIQHSDEANGVTKAATTATRTYSVPHGARPSTSSHLYA